MHKNQRSNQPSSIHPRSFPISSPAFLASVNEKVGLSVILPMLFVAYLTIPAAEPRKKFRQLGNGTLDQFSLRK